MSTTNTTPTKPRDTIKLGIDARAKRDHVARQVDGATPHLEAHSQDPRGSSAGRIEELRGRLLLRLHPAAHFSEVPAAAGRIPAPCGCQPARSKAPPSSATRARREHRLTLVVEATRIGTSMKKCWCRGGDQQALPAEGAEGPGSLISPAGPDGLGHPVDPNP